MLTRKRHYHPISKSILNLRLERGETQEEFAKHFSVGRTTICMWEQYGPSPLPMVRAHIKIIMKRLRDQRYNKPPPKWKEGYVKPRRRGPPA